MAYLLKAIAHPARMQILLLKDKELSVSDLQNKLSIEQSLLSHHLIRMRNKGVLDARRQGKNIFYYLTDPASVKALNALLTSHFIQAWISRLNQGVS